MKKRVISALLSVFILLVMTLSLNTNVSAAASGSVSLSTSTTNVIVGNQITVTVSYTASSPGLMEITCNFNYDTGKFEYVSCDKSSSSNPYGVIPLDFDPSSSEATSGTATIVLKAIGTGTASFSLSDCTAIDSNIEPASMSLGTASVQVWAAGSDDSSLSSLSVAGATLSPAFSAWTTDYTCYVGTDVSSVSVSATTTQGGRTELGGNPGSLNYGNNYITITSYAPYGNTRTYTINVVRPAPETTEAPTEPPTVYDDSIKVNGTEYSLMDFNQEDIPSGYEIEVISIGDDDVPVVKNAATGITLVYLEDADGNGAFFVYDEKTKLYYSYITLTHGDNTYVVVDSSLASSIPANTTEAEMLVLGNTIKVYVSDENNEFAYFYAVNSSGVYGWYSYDTVEGTAQRLNAVTIFEDNSESLEAAEGEIDSLKDAVESLEDTNTQLRSQNSTIRSIRNIIIIVTGVLLVLAVVIIIVIVKNRIDSKHSINLDTDDIIDEEDNDDEENDEKFLDDGENEELVYSVEESETEETEAEETEEEVSEETKADESEEEAAVTTEENAVEEKETTEVVDETGNNEENEKKNLK